MFGIRQLKKNILATDLKTATYKMLYAGSNLRPSRQLPISVLRDGGRWVCIFETDPDPLKCVIAYGDSPEQATQNFDMLWNGAPGFILDDEQEEEEAF